MVLFINFAPVMRLYNQLSIITALCALVLCACEDNYTICNQSKQVNYRAGFYTKNGAVDVPTAPAALTLTFPGTSNFIYSQQPNIPFLLLGLNPAADSIQYLIRVGNTLPADTITFFYTNGNQDLGSECGVITVHNFTRVRTTTNTLDSIRIVAPVVNNTEQENLRIYY
jgi:hypothetical protein